MTMYFIYTLNAILKDVCVWFMIFLTVIFHGVLVISNYICNGYFIRNSNNIQVIIH